MYADVVVIGGGPAGALCASLLRRHGLSVRLFEKDAFPRPRVGETTVPVWADVLARAGVLDRATEETPIHKIGFLLRWGAGDDLWTADFPHGDGSTPAGGFHMDRAAFDALLLDHAASLGVEVHQPATVTSVVADNTGFVVRWEDHAVSARFVVDASGPARFLARQWDLGVRRYGDMNNYAVWGYWSGSAVASPGPPPTDHRRWSTVSASELGWLWHIPITTERTSVGLVTTKETRREHSGTLDSLYRDAIAGAPAIAGLLADGALETSLDVMDYWSYRLERVCGPGWYAIGDAAMFVDPILASGLQWAAIGANMAANAIATELAGPCPGLHDAYQRAFDERIDRYHAFARAWYAANAAIDSPHWRRKAQTLAAHPAGSAERSEDAFTAVALQLATDPLDRALPDAPPTVRATEEFFPWLARTRLFPTGSGDVPAYRQARVLEDARSVTANTVMTRWRRLALAERRVVWGAPAVRGSTWHTTARTDLWWPVEHLEVAGLRLPVFEETEAVVNALGTPGSLVDRLRAALPTTDRTARCSAIVELLLQLDLLGYVVPVGRPASRASLAKSPLMRAVLQPVLAACSKPATMTVALDWLGERADLSLMVEGRTIRLHAGDARFEPTGEVMARTRFTTVTAAAPVPFADGLQHALARRASAENPWTADLAGLRATLEYVPAAKPPLTVRGDSGPPTVLAIVGSPRAKGNTDQLVDALRSGAAEAGADTEVVTLRDVEVRPCHGTFACRGHGHCVTHDDDFDRLLARVYRADAIVFATPNYWTAASAQLKAFLDRLVSAVDWDFDRRPTGFRSLLAGRKAAVLVAQDARQAAGANALLHFFELFFRDVELESAGAVVLTDAPHHEAPEAGERAEVLAEARALGRKLVASAGCSPSIS